MPSEFDIREELDERGFPNADGWSQVSATADEVCIAHETGFEVRIIQRKPLGSDLPFRAIRVDESTNNEQQIAESDYLTSVLENVEAYILGFADRNRTELKDLSAKVRRTEAKVEEQQKLLAEKEKLLEEREEQLEKLEQQLTEIEDELGL